MYELKDLIEVAKKGAVLGHPRCPANTIMDNDGHFRYPGDSKLLLWDGFFDNRWTIETPHPGACKECKGLGWFDPDMDDGIIGQCPRCKGTGNEPPERDEPETRVLSQNVRPEDVLIFNEDYFNHGEHAITLVEQQQRVHFVEERDGDVYVRFYYGGDLRLRWGNIVRVIRTYPIKHYC